MLTSSCFSRLSMCMRTRRKGGDLRPAMVLSLQLKHAMLGQMSPRSQAAHKRNHYLTVSGLMHVMCPQVYCYEDPKLLKLFSAVIRILYDADILDEDTIKFWYKKGSHPKV
jgi:eIF4-gamma/eIF5/eIF2-epsilon